VPLGYTARSFRGNRPFALERSSGRVPGREINDAPRLDAPALLAALAPTEIQPARAGPFAAMARGDVRWLGTAERLRFRGQNGNGPGHLLAIVLRGDSCR